MRPEDTAAAGGDDGASVNDGDQAFPLVAHEDWKQIHYGMSLRDYFIAHAPANPWPMFAPVTAPRPRPGPWKDDEKDMFYATASAAERACGDCYHCVNQGDLDAWDAEYQLAFHTQWPAHWADAMLKARGR